MDQKVKPHWAWFFTVPVFFIGGIVGAIVLTVAGVVNIAENMQRVSVPGQGTVSIQQPGDYVLFYEQTGTAQASIPQGLEVQVVEAGGDVESATPLTLEQVNGSFTYNNGDVAGRNYRRVNFPKAGDYIIMSRVADGVPASGKLAVGGDPSGKLAGTIFLAMAMGFGGPILSIIVLVVLVLMRAKSKKRINQQRWAQQGQAPMQQPGGMPPPQPPQQ